MRSTALPVWLTLAVALLGHEAMAASSSSATLSNFRITLVDLAPDDGITPTLTFVGEGGPPFSSFAWGRASLYALPSGTELFTDFYQANGPTAPFSSAEGSASHPNAVAVSSLQAAADRLGPHVFSAQGSALAAAGAQAMYYAGASAPGYISLTFSVTPFTQVLFDGDVLLEAGVTSSDPSDQASARAEVFAYGQGDSGGQAPSQSSRDLLGISADVSQPWLSVSRAMSASFLNNGSALITGQLVASVYVSGVSSSAVPEASALGLVLAGGGVVAAGAQRRARIAKRACTNSKA